MRAEILVGVHHCDLAASNPPPLIAHRHPGRYVGRITMKRPHNAAFRAVATRSPTSPLSWTRLLKAEPSIGSSAEPWWLTPYAGPADSRGGRRWRGCAPGRTTARR